MQAIEVEKFSFSYPDGTSALRDISFSVSSGERVVILGPNGAGKSSLLLSVAAIYRGTGVIRICGDVVGRATISKIRRRMGLVFQNPDDQLFMPTVLDNVSFGLINEGVKRPEAEDRAMRTLEAMGIATYAERSVNRLSHGQRKRAALASALVVQPEILLLDEPTSDLDPRGRRSLIELLGDQKQTLIIATHDLELTLELADRILVLDGGAIRSIWSRDELLAYPALLSEHDMLPMPSHLEWMAVLAGKVRG